MNLFASDTHGRSIALMKFLSWVAKRLGVAEHVYVVGGAVRNFLIDQPIKDIDLVVDSISLEGKDSAWFAKEIQRVIPVHTSLATNQYGVAILTVSSTWNLDSYDMKGETIEIANARKESYGGADGKGKGYKPTDVQPATIHEDVLRREFTFNTLLWRLLDLEHGPDRAEVIDITGLGRPHLEEKIIQTPLDPDKTFSDDPTRMLRAVKFIAKYGFKLPSDMVASIRRNAAKLKKMPWDAVRKILVDDILTGPAPRKSVELLEQLGLGEVLREMLHEEPGFASSLNRSLSDAETLLLFDLVDLGWALKPLSFLDAAARQRVREILLRFNNDFGENFISNLKKPNIDQTKLFGAYAIPMKERQIVTQIAREVLLKEPLLIEHPPAFEAEVEAEIKKRYPALSTEEKVAARFMFGRSV
jgi:tRNA nucleotidyltransferase/poly(A) polymerase